MSIFKHKSNRRIEVRKAIQRPSWGWWRDATRGPNLYGLAFLVVYLLIAGAIVADARTDPPQRVGQVANRTYTARVPFPSPDPLKTEENQKRASELVPAVYEPNVTFLDLTLARFRTLPVIASTVEFASLTEEVQKPFGLTPAVHELLKKYQAEGKPTADWEARVTRIYESLHTRFLLLDNERYQAEKQNVASSVRVSSVGKPVSDRDVFNVSDATEVRRALGEELDGLERPIAEMMVNYFVNGGEATHRYDSAETDKHRKSARDAVPQAYTQFERDSVLISTGDSITTGGYELLLLEQSEYLSTLPAWARWMYFAGPLTLLAILSGLIAAVVFVLRPRIVRNPARGLALMGLLIFTLALGWITGRYSWAGATIAPSVLLAVVLAIAYDTRLATAVSVLQAAALCVALRQGLGLYVVTVLACVVAAAQLVEVRKRGRLIRMGLVTGIVAASGVLIVSLSERRFLPEGSGAAVTIVATEALVAGLATVAVGFFVLGVLPFVERAFKVTTSMTLLELADMEHPLLRRLAQEAPGTFNHSLQVASLAEAGVEAIGGDGLLARVGAYYHDIGKTHKPGYFIENQAGSINRHEKLSPAMSLLIIVAHVKDGVEMAREYGLPASLIQFIETHHGTTLVEYFYHAAKRGRDERQQPGEVEYRYPGPKPQTKEAAVLMICDASESACRSMVEPTATRVEHLVRKITHKRLLDGQFDECEITLNELRRVEEAVSKALTAIYHGRVPYPEEDTQKEPQRAAV